MHDAMKKEDEVISMTTEKQMRYKCDCVQSLNVTQDNQPHSRFTYSIVSPSLNFASSGHTLVTIYTSPSLPLVLLTVGCPAAIHTRWFKYDRDKL